jgi:hypothetical protein
VYLAGTGKTATVVASINALRKEVAAGTLPDFSYIEINCLHLKSPMDACKWNCIKPSNCCPHAYFVISGAPFLACSSMFNNPRILTHSFTHAHQIHSFGEG